MSVFRQIAVLSHFMGSAALPEIAQAQNNFEYSFGYEQNSNEPRHFSVPTSALIKNETLVKNGILPNRLSFMTVSGDRIHAAFHRQKPITEYGQFHLTYGASITGAFYMNSYVHADFNPELVQARAIIADRIVTTLQTNFQPYGDALNINKNQSERAFRRIANRLVYDAHLVKSVREDELNALLPEDIPQEIKNEILTLIPSASDVSQQIVGSDIIKGLRKLNEVDGDHSGPSYAAMLEANAFVRGTYHIEPLSPFFQLNAGYEAFGFLKHDQDAGGLIHGPTASIEVGVIGKISDDINGSLSIEQPFSFGTQEGLFDISSNRSTDAFLKGSLNKDWANGTLTIGGTYVPETNNNSVFFKYGWEF